MKKEKHLVTSQKLNYGEMMPDLVLIGFVMSYFSWIWKQVFSFQTQCVNIKVPVPSGRISILPTIQEIVYNFEKH